MSAIYAKLADELGLKILFSAPRDAHLLILQRVFRLVAYGQSTLVLTGLLHSLGFADFQMGLFMTLTLLGDVGGSLILTIFADRWGRRKVLLIGSLLMASSGVVFATSGSYTVLLLAAMAGVISPSGNEIGPFKAIEESTLATLIPSDQRSTIFDWYAVFSGLAGSLGSLSSGWITFYLQQTRGWSVIQAYRFVFAIYTTWGLVKSGLTICLSERCEVDSLSKTAEERRLLESSRIEEEDVDGAEEAMPEGRFLGLTIETRRKVARLSALFGLDNLASGLVPLSFIIYFFTTKFNLDEGTLGTTFFTTSFIAALSNLIAASLARRIGNVKTMAFTHLPSAICLALIPLPSSFQMARVILIARFCTAQMDGAPRTAFLTSYVPGDERTSVMGIINVVKTICQSVGPTITGYLAGRGWIWISFLAAGCMKASYDLAILYFFSRAMAS